MVQLLIPVLRINVRLLNRYTQGATLDAHVDRVETHAASAIINIAQSDPTKAWPLQIVDHSGNAHELSMKPAEVVLYESARLHHARPQPLEGEWFANVFVHFHPPGALDINCLYLLCRGSTDRSDRHIRMRMIRCVLCVLAGWEQKWTSSGARKKLDSCVKDHIAAQVVDSSFDIFEHVGLNGAQAPLQNDRREL
jgi:hypothetical protein